MRLMSPAAARRAMLRPKPEPKPFLPVLPYFELSWAIGALAPAERKLLDWIAEHSDLLCFDSPANGPMAFLLVEVEPQHLDTLAAVGAAAEDRELDLHDETEDDDDRSNDDPAEGVFGIDGHQPYLEEEEQEGRPPAGARKAYEQFRAARSQALNEPWRRRPRPKDMPPLVGIDAQGRLRLPDGTVQRRAACIRKGGRK